MPCVSSSAPAAPSASCRRIVVADFDGTLTRRDTLIALFRYARGTAFTLGILALYAPLLVLMKLKLYPNWKAKQKVFARFFRGMPLEQFDDLCRHFAADNGQLMRPEGIRCIRGALALQCRVLVVSASAENWVRAFADRYLGAEGAETGAVTVLGTLLETRGGVLTGRFASPNCYGAEKVRRVQAALPDVAVHRARWHVTAYGDSRGDTELLAWADEGHYKPFRTAE